MIRSMTGFGDAADTVDGVHYAIELRSLNNRYYKANIRLPEEIASLEAEVDTILRAKLKRGSITLIAKMRGRAASAADQINDDVLVSYLERLETLHTKFAEREQAVTIDLTALLTLPGVLQPGDDSNILSHARPVIKDLVEKACDKAMKMRCTEGKAVGDDLAHQRSVIRDRVDQVAERAPGVVQEYHDRLHTRINELLTRAELKVDEKDLIKEVAIFAERADISEELNRLGGHLEQFADITSNSESKSVGRTLEFLAQEMLREANTIGSKSSDDLISRAVVDMKGAIDRIKEQAANVE